jgi:hypothetical protein
MGTGSSRDPLRVGMLFLGVLSGVILSMILVCFVWKAIEVLVEKYRRKSSVPRHGQREPTDVEGQLEVRGGGGGRLALTWKVVEVLRKMLPGSAAGCRRHLNDDATKMEGREKLCAPAAAAGDAGDTTSIIG